MMVGSAAARTERCPEGRPTEGQQDMEWTLEVVVVPVSDVDRAKEFYADKVGFKVDVDQQVAPGIRVVQLTPPGSRCSISLLEGMPGAPGQASMAPGSLSGL